MLLKKRLSKTELLYCPVEPGFMIWASGKIHRQKTGTYTVKNPFSLSFRKYNIGVIFLPVLTLDLPDDQSNPFLPFLNKVLL
jgi:hypothetical protein